ncbi:MAG: divalent-cation tolerance protein CutA [Candidatus Zipacnadales bacterium]
MPEYVVVMVTAPTMEEAKRIARQLLERRLIACANLLPRATSLFWWQDQIDEVEEVVMVMKTRRELFDEVVSVVSEVHSYQICEVIALPILKGNIAYLNWIDESVS